MSKLLNLDAIIPADRFFELAGKTFKVPGSLSVQEALTISKLGQETQENPNEILKVLNAVWEILKPYNKDRKDEDFLNNIKIEMLSALLEFIFQNKGGEEKDQSSQGEESGR